MKIDLEDALMTLQQDCKADSNVGVDIDSNVYRVPHENQPYLRQKTSSRDTNNFEILFLSIVPSSHRPSRVSVAWQ